MPAFWRNLIALPLLLSSSAAIGQLEGRLYLSSENIAAGEPVFVIFELKNLGKEAVRLITADPYSFCSGFSVSVSSDPAQYPGNSCSTGFGGDCLAGADLVKPGGTYSQRILLNFEHNIAAPGSYEIKAHRTVTYAVSPEEIFTAAAAHRDFEATFLLQVRPTGKSPSLQRYVEQLTARDEAVRNEAARVLASTAPPSLEPVLLTFAGNPEFRQFAPMALKKLNTERSRAALGTILVETEPGTYENMEAANALARLGDKQYARLLLAVAEKKPEIGGYVADAAELAGEDAIPLLLRLAESPDKEYTAINAVSALGYTGSRQAVPLLIAFFGSQPGAYQVPYALQILTHRSSRFLNQFDPAAESRRWSLWWAREGATARIYRPSECGRVTPLD